MASKMLIDAAHPEETRVCVVRGNRIEEFDYESASRRPLKGNIYLAKVTRVEPSLQAAFVEYGGNRHGFLAFSEIHPDYYQIPVADRQALLEADAEDARLAREEEDAEPEKTKPRRRRSRSARSKDDKVASDPVDDETAAEDSGAGETTDGDATDVEAASGEADTETVSQNADMSEPETSEADDTDGEQDVSQEASSADEDSESDSEDSDLETDADSDDDIDVSAADDDTFEAAPKPRKRAPRKNYKIQEVIKRRQVLLIQVVKEERGNKGAALTTYMSLAGRYCVLMPNTARGGGISRKITDASDRRRLKDVIREVEVPQGMGLIVRTAGAQRTKTEIRRDYDYLLRMWESVRELTLKSAAPTLVYEEGNLIKRSIRDLYSKDIEEVVVEGEEGFREAKDFMKMLMPSHARNVKLYKDTRQLFTRHQVESQLDGLFTPNVTLPSGGYIVMNQTEALVSIDINSGKATREHSIEDTALKTNMEAAVEISRQLRLRDLAGLIVIDFIDMEENRNNRAVERKLKDALKNDRARIQVGRISHFGLLEMSRQRLRQGMMESSTMQCPHCEGTGVIRGVSSCALSVLRGIEEHLLSRKPESLDVRVHPDVAFYIFNEKRDHLLSLEENYGISIYVLPDAERALADSIIERKPDRKGPTARPVASETAVAMGDGMEANEEPAASDADDTDADADEADNKRNDEVQLDENGEPRKKRRRRRGRRGGRKQREERDGEEAANGEDIAASAEDPQADSDDTPDANVGETDVAADAISDDDKPKKRRRRSRGGRNKSADEATGTDTDADADADEIAATTDTQATEAAAPEADPAVEAEAETEEKPKARKRSPRKAAKKAKAESPEAAAEDAGDGVAKAEAEPADDETPAKKPRKRAAKKVKSAAAEAPVETVAANGSSAPVEQAEAEQTPPKWTPPAPTVDPATAPKKAGWWGKR